MNIARGDVDFSCCNLAYDVFKVALKIPLKDLSQEHQYYAHCSLSLEHFSCARSLKAFSWVEAMDR